MDPSGINNAQKPMCWFEKTIRNRETAQNTNTKIHEVIRMGKSLNIILPLRQLAEAGGK
jgi:hypothetical protein